MPAIITNIDLINTFDANGNIIAARVLDLVAGNQYDPHEHAAQCVAMEFLRSLMGTGMTAAEFDDFANNPTAWDALAAESVTRCKLNVNVPVWELGAEHLASGVEKGSQYYASNYPTVIAQNSGNLVTFSRLGGIQGQ